MKKTVKSYNVRIVDNGDDTYSVDWVHWFKPNKSDSGGQWVAGSVGKMIRLLTNRTVRRDTYRSGK